MLQPKKKLQDGQELEEAKQAVIESENKLIYKEEIADVAMAAKDAAQNSLRLADLRSSRLSYSMVVELSFRCWFM